MYKVVSSIVLLLCHMSIIPVVVDAAVFKQPDILQQSVHNPLVDIIGSGASSDLDEFLLSDSNPTDASVNAVTTDDVNSEQEAINRYLALGLLLSGVISIVTIGVVTRRKYNKTMETTDSISTTSNSIEIYKI